MSEDLMDDKRIPWLLKRLIKEMRSALSESDKVAHVIEDIETCGLKVMLVVDAVIQPMDQALWAAMPPNPASEPQLNLSTDDVTWLRSLRIVPGSDQPNSPSSKT